MTQTDFGTLDPSTKSGTQLAADLNAWRDTVHSNHRGNTRPTYVVAGMLWVQTVSASEERIYYYSGADDLHVATIDLTTGKMTLITLSIKAAQATPPGSPATGDMYLVTATATGAWAGQEGKLATWYGATWVFSTALPNITIMEESGVLWVSDSSGTIMQPRLTNVERGIRNRIINGNFDFWQYATSQTTSDIASCDRFGHYNAGTTKTTSRQSFTLGTVEVPGNPDYYCRTVVSSVVSSAAYCSMSHRVEYVKTLSGKTATVTLYARAGSGTPNIAVEVSQYFGTGGSPSAFNVVHVETITLSTSFKKYTFTVDLPSVSGKTIGTNNDDYLLVNIWFDAGSDHNSRTNSLGQQSGTFDIARMSLVEGDATHEDDPYGYIDKTLEFRRCLRFFRKSYDPDQAPGSTTYVGCLYLRNVWASNTQGTYMWSIQCEPPMRNTPTVTVYSPNSGASANIYDIGNAVDVGGAAAYVGKSHFTVQNTGGLAGGNGYAACHYTAKAEL